jgi:ERCC4-type nuclease
MIPLPITIDTREQTPWHFPPEQVVATVGTLKTADYAVTGDDDFAIERKSLDDFVGTIASGWDRFVKEIGRMAGWPARVVIVEGSFSELVFETRQGEVIPPAHSHFRISPPFIMKRIGELTMLGVSVLFAENAEYASALAVAILRQRAVELGIAP